MRLLARAPLPPLPRAEELGVGQTPRRPGDLHEALPLTSSQGRLVAHAAGNAGVQFDIAATVLLEAAMAVDDVGAPLAARRKRTGGPATDVAMARYLRSITIGRGRPGATQPQAHARIPARLVARLGDRDVDALLVAVDIEIALAWEAASAAAGRTLSEWVLLRALVAARG